MKTDEQLRRVIANGLRVPIEQITMDADLIADLGGDSLALAELGPELESQTGLTLPPDRLLDATTVGDMKRLLDELRRETD